MNYVEFNEDNNKDSDQNSIQTNKQSKQINENMDPEENIDQTYDELMYSFNKTVEDMKKKFDSDKTYFLPAIKSFVN